MIAKITRGATFRGAVRYVLGERPGLDHDRQAEIIGGNMPGRTPVEVTREFEAVRRQRPDIVQPVEHVAISFARDERRLANEEMARLTKGSRLGRAYTFEGVQRELGVDYERKRDLPELLRAAQATRSREPSWRGNRGVAAQLARRLAGRLRPRVPGLRELRTATSLIRGLKNLSLSPTRTVTRALIQGVVPQRQIAELILRALVRAAKGGPER